LEQHGIDVALRTPLIVGVNEHNRDYLATKGERMGHHINDDDL
jgi:GTP cyclohydrolase II